MDSEEFSRRQDDIVMGQLLQKVQDSIELANEREKASVAWRKSHDESSKEWRDKIDLRLGPVEAWISNANWSWKLVIGAVAFTGAIFKSWDWVKSHFK